MTGLIATSELSAVQLIASLRPEAGGPSYSVPRLALAVAGSGIRSEIFFVSSDGREARNWSELNAVGFESPSAPLLGRFSFSSRMYEATRGRARSGAVLHTHGLWLAPNVYPAWLRKRNANVRLVHSPRGMLGKEALRISSWKKMPIWWLAQRQALASADAIHATAQSEADEIRAAGLDNPIAVIPNGIDLPDPALLVSISKFAQMDKTILSLGRIHPKKGLDRLIRAWRLVQDEFPHWSLRIVGPAEGGHDRDLRELAKSIEARHVAIEPPVFGEAKWSLIAGASLFVLATHNENFGLSVAEALACEVPVICTQGAPWGGLVKERCGWWVDQSVPAIAEAIRAAASLSDAERRTMGARGREWMKRDYGWDRVGYDMSQVYRWLKQGGDMPSTIQLR